MEETSEIDDTSSFGNSSSFNEEYSNISITTTDSSSNNGINQPEVSKIIDRFNSKIPWKKFFSRTNRGIVGVFAILFVLFLLAIFMVIIGMILIHLRSKVCENIYPPTYPRLPEEKPRKEWIQESENDDAKFVLMHIPSFEAFFGGLHPTGALFEHGFNLSNARQQMLNFQCYLTRLKIEVYNIRDILIQSPREDLIDLASKYLVYTYNGAVDEEIEKCISEDYKRSTLSKMSSSGLVDILLLQPEVELEKATHNTAIKSVRTSINPLPNLLFTRDQQITTKKGIVIGRMNSPQRMIERELLEIVWSELGITPIGRIPIHEEKRSGKRRRTQYYLEGGDFVPIDDHLSMIGVGLRTNYESVRYLMENDLFGTDEVAVVVDTNDLNQERMHLDTVFNTVNDKIVVLLQSIIDSKSPKDKYYRRVDVYRKNYEKEGSYELVKNVTLYDFLTKDINMKVVPISHEDQLEYMINFLNLGRTHGIASVNPSLNVVLKKHLREEELKGIKVKHFDFSDVHAMYGALHCSTQVGRWPKVHSSNQFLSRICS